MVEIGVRNGVMASHDKGRNKEAQVDNILGWLTKYSPPVVLLLALAAAFIFVSKQVTENAISAQFAQPRPTRLLHGRSRFGEILASVPARLMN